MATTALGLALAASHSQIAKAQTIQLPSVSVEENKGEEEYKVDQPSMNKLTQPLLDTPQSIVVVPKQVLQDQNVTTLRDALRNVSGISIGAGEGGRQGDSISIRGFSAANDMYLDGMSDYGSYYRDPFNLDGVEALTGPSSVLFGKGSTGGVINQVSKTPGLTPFIAGSASLGTNMTERLTADVNTPITAMGPGAAFRVNLMAHRNEWTDRDEGENERFGIAPSLAFGLGTDTRTTINYFHFQEDDVPDYGVPWVPYIGQSVTNPSSASDSNFYGFKNSDFLKTNVDIITGKIEHDINDMFTIRDQLRFANYVRDFRITEPSVAALQAPGTPLNSIPVTRNILGGSSTETTLENQLDLTSKFSTGFIDHTAVTGVSVGRQTSHPNRYTITGVTATNLGNPNTNDPYTGVSTLNRASSGEAEAETVGVYALDTLKLNEQWSLMGAVRYDRFDAEASTVSGLHYGGVDEALSGRGAVVYKPYSYASAYLQYGTSFNPSLESLSASSTTATQSGSLSPEQNKTWEAGTKWDLFKNRLSLTGAVFQTEKTNARESVPGTTLQTLSGNIVVQGVTLGATGRLTDQWQVFTGYSLQEGEVESSPNPADMGHRPGNLPEHSLSMWSTYDLTRDYQIGGGVNYVSSRYVSNANDALGTRREVDEYWTAQAMGKYRITDNVDLQLNIYNLFDADYFDQLHPSHVVPGEGRTAVLSTNFKF